MIHFTYIMKIKYHEDILNGFFFLVKLSQCNIVRNIIAFKGPLC